MTIAVVMVILTIDLIISEKNENRFYFLLETFNKLSINVSSVQKYFNFKMLTTSNIYKKETRTMDKM